MKKKYWVLLTFLLISYNALGARGMIIVLNAPLFKKPSQTSPIVQYARKGDHVWIHNRHFDQGEEYALKKGRKGDTQSDELDAFIDRKQDLKTNSSNRKKKSPSLETDTFYETMDRNGRPAYIHKAFVKIVHNDEREFSEDVGRFNQYDPTDYRLSEPLPEKYPFNRPVDYRYTISYGVGPQRKRTYRYNQNILKEQHTTLSLIETSLIKKVESDISDQIYFGGKIQYFSGSSEFTLDNGDEATETKSKVGFGPLMSYDIFRYRVYRVSIMGGLTIQYHRALIDYFQDSIFTEARTFTGWSFDAQVGTNFQREIFIPNTHLFLKTQVRLSLPYKVKADTPPENLELWNTEKDRISYPFGGEYSWILGLTSRF